jgi:hypothetical protein
VASPEPSLSAAPEPSPPEEEGYDDIDDLGSANGGTGGNGTGLAPRPARTARSSRPRRLDGTARSVTAPRRDDGVDGRDGAATLEEVDGIGETELVDDQYERAVVDGATTGSVTTIDPPATATGMAMPLVDDGIEVLDDDDDDFAEIGAPTGARGRLRARKVRRVVRYVSPWSVLKVSLLFYACLWVILTIASVLLWRVAVASGVIGNMEKFLARAFGESEFTIDGREIFRASTVAGLILVFAGTGFTVMMSLLFNVICDITGGIRFTVLELETVKRVRRARTGE